MSIHSVDIASRATSADSKRDDDDVVAIIAIASAASGTTAVLVIRAEPYVAAMQCCKGSEAASLAPAEEDGD